jgi:hypothetical protein
MVDVLELGEGVEVEIRAVRLERRASSISRKGRYLLLCVLVPLGAEPLGFCRFEVLASSGWSLGRFEEGVEDDGPVCWGHGVG